MHKIFCDFVAGVKKYRGDDGFEGVGQEGLFLTAEMMAAKMALEKLGGKPGEELSEEPKK